MHHQEPKILRDMMTRFLEFNIEKSDVCMGHALANYTKAVFPSNENTSTMVLYLIHTNLCGFVFSISSLDFEYYVTFIDHFSRKT